MKNSLKMIYAVITGVLMTTAVQVNAVAFIPGPYSDPNCCDVNKCQLAFEADLLYFAPQLDGLEAAFGTTAIDTTLAGGILTTTVTESDIKPHSEWNPGFRINAGIDSNRFVIGAQWTCYHQGKAKFSEGAQNGNWTINYDVVDLLAGYRISLSPCFNFTPFIGVRGALIKQKLKSNLTTLVTTPVGASTVLSTIDNKEDFWGIAPEIGLEIDWLIGCNFSIYGNVDVVSYYGKVKGTSHGTNVFATTTSVSNGKSHRPFNTWGTDAEIGIYWSKSITCNWGCSCIEIDFLANLGAEQHRIYDFSDLGSDGALSLDGGVFGIGIAVRY